MSDQQLFKDCPNGIDEKRRAFFENNPGLYKALADRGIVAGPTSELAQLIGGPMERALVQAVIEYLPSAPSDEARLRCVHLLSNTKSPYPGMSLVEIFESTQDPFLRRVIPSVLGQTRPQGIEDWFKKVLSDPAGGDTRRTLAALVDCMENPEQYLPILREHFADFPIGACMSFGCVGGKEELEFLLRQHGRDFGLAKDNAKYFEKQLEKSIAKLEKRVARQQKRKES